MPTKTVKQDTKEWHELRERSTRAIPGKRSALYFFVSNILGLKDKIPVTPLAHYPLCLFIEKATGIPEIDNCTYQLIHAPRGLGKSALATNARTTQELCMGALDPEYEDRAIVLFNETQNVASKFLGMIKANFEENELVQRLFPEIIPDFDKTKWSGEEIILNRKTPRPGTPSVLAAGVGATRTGVHCDKIIVDDMLSEDLAENAVRGNTTEIEKMRRWIPRLQPLLNSPTRDPITFIGCIAEGEPVLMADGTWKPIQEIEVGDEVWGCRKDKPGWEAKTVSGVHPQGISDVVEVDVAGRQLVCTEDHPLLATQGRSDGVHRRWENAGELSFRLEVLENADVGEGYYDLDWLWFLGFMWGDGWVTKQDRPSYSDGAYAVCFSLGEDEDLNQKAERLMDEYAPISTPIRTGKRECRVDSVTLGKRLEDCNWKIGSRAPDKSIPEWVFKTPRDAKRAFLRGLCDADGSQTSETRWALSGSSKQLIEDAHRLAMTCGVRPSSITSRTRENQPPNSPEPIVRTEYHVALNFLDRENTLHKYQPTVTELSVQRPVYDLTVDDGECAFVASGVPVGNTPWWAGDTYEYVERFFGDVPDDVNLDDAPKEEFNWTLKLPSSTESGGERISVRLYKRGDLAVFRRPALVDGRSIFPERYTKEELHQMSQKPGVSQFFHAQYLLDPVSGEDTVFDEDWLQPYAYDGPYAIRFYDQQGKPRRIRIDDLTTFISVDAAFSDKQSAARTAIPVVGTDGQHLFLLEDFAERGLGSSDIAEQVSSFAFKYGPQRIYVETIGQQKALMDPINQELRRENISTTVEEIGRHSQQNKDARIWGMDRYFKKRIFYVHNSHQNFKQEYSAFPRGAALRDVLDALSFQIDGWDTAMRMQGRQGASQDEIQEGHQRAVERIRQEMQ